MAIDLDGTIRWGDGSADFDTAMYRKRSVSILYDPPPLAAEASGKVLVPSDSKCASIFSGVQSG
jgi:hypothetical protein